MAKFPELDTIEFNSSTSVAAYSKTARNTLRDLAWEFEQAAGELESTLARLDRYPFWKGLQVRWRARRVGGRLRRASAACLGAAAEAVKFNAQYRREFLDPAMTSRDRPRGEWKF